VPYIRAKAESLGLTANIGLAPVRLASRSSCSGVRPGPSWLTLTLRGGGGVVAFLSTSRGSARRARSPCASRHIKGVHICHNEEANYERSARAKPSSRRPGERSASRVVGVGNCASSLVQGVHYYRDAKPGDDIPGSCMSTSADHMRESSSSRIRRRQDKVGRTRGRDLREPNKPTASRRPEDRREGQPRMNAPRTGNRKKKKKKN